MFSFHGMSNKVTSHLFIGNPWVNYLMVGEGAISGLGFFGLITGWAALPVALIFATTGLLGICQKWILNMDSMKVRQ